MANERLIREGTVDRHGVFDKVKPRPDCPPPAAMQPGKHDVEGCVAGAAIFIPPVRKPRDFEELRLLGIVRGFDFKGKDFQVVSDGTVCGTTVSMFHNDERIELPNVCRVKFEIDANNAYMPMIEITIREDAEECCVNARIKAQKREDDEN